MAENEGAAAAPAKKKSPMKLVLVLVALGAGGYFYKQNAATKEEAAKKAWEENPIHETVVFSMDTQTVNLADGDRYARCQVAIGFELDPVDAEAFRAALTKTEEGGGGGGHGEGEAKAKPAGDKPMPPHTEPTEEATELIHLLGTEDVRARLQDVLIAHLSSRMFEDLQTQAGKDRLKADLRKSFSAVIEGSGHNGGGEQAKTDEGDDHSDSHEADSEPLVKEVYLREFVMQ